MLSNRPPAVACASANPDQKLPEAAMEISKHPAPPLQAEGICFGLNRETDERSLKAFLQRFAEPAFLQILIPRLQEEEITALLDFLSRLMHKHCSENEYHQLFLKD